MQLTHWVKSYLREKKETVCPQSSVKINQISLDESGEHVGICSEDGKVSAGD